MTGQASRIDSSGDASSSSVARTSARIMTVFPVPDYQVRLPFGRADQCTKALFSNKYSNKYENLMQHVDFADNRA
jgi:hypothetical protein